MHAKSGRSKKEEKKQIKDTMSPNMIDRVHDVHCGTPNICIQVIPKHIFDKCPINAHVIVGNKDNLAKYRTRPIHFMTQSTTNINFSSSYMM